MEGNCFLLQQKLSIFTREETRVPGENPWVRLSAWDLIYNLTETHSDFKGQEAEVGFMATAPASNSNYLKEYPYPVEIVWTFTVTVFVTCAITEVGGEAKF